MAPNAGGGARPQSPGHGHSPVPPHLPDESGRESPLPPGSDSSTHGPGSSGAATAGAGSFTRVATVGWGEGPGAEGGSLAAGTSGGCVCLLDVARGELAAHFDCAPSAQVRCGRRGCTLAALQGRLMWLLCGQAHVVVVWLLGGVPGAKSPGAMCQGPGTVRVHTEAN